MNEASVPCAGCTLCCERDLILLFPQYGDDPSTFEALPLDGVDPTAQSGPTHMVKRQEDGTCFYLAKGLGCSIYERRPAMCRAFDCRAFYLAAGSRANRRAMIASGQATGSMFARGKELLRQAADEEE